MYSAGEQKIGDSSIHGSHVDPNQLTSRSIILFQFEHIKDPQSAKKGMDRAHRIKSTALFPPTPILHSGTTLAIDLTYQR